MKFLEYFRLAHSEEGKPSGKRFWGGIMVGFAQIILLAATILSFSTGGGLSSTIKDMWEMDVVVGSTLLGLNTVTRIFKNSTISASDNNPQSE